VEEVVYLRSLCLVRSQHASSALYDRTAVQKHFSSHARSLPLSLSLSLSLSLFVGSFCHLECSPVSPFITFIGFRPLSSLKSAVRFMDAAPFSRQEMPRPILSRAIATAGTLSRTSSIGIINYHGGCIAVVNYRPRCSAS